jgi:hypothetical protein
MLWFLVAIGGLLYRIRGGWLPTGSTQLARAAWCVPTGILVGWLAGSPWAALAGFLAAWAGLFLPNEPWQRMETPAHHWLAAGVGVVRVGLLVAVLWTFGTAVLPWAFLGAGNAAVYWLGWRLPPRAMGGMIDWHTAWGELLFGALAWAALLATAHV